MGFLDKLKGAAQNAMEQVNKISEQQQAAKELKQYKTHTVKGVTLEEKEGVRYGLALDNEKERVLIIAEKNGGRELLAEHSMEDVAEFKHNNVRISDYDAFANHMHYNNVVLKSGDVFEVSDMITINKEKTEVALRLEAKRKNEIFNLINFFMLHIKDDSTKEYVNNFYKEDGLMPIFDGNGEVSVESMQENVRIIKSRSL